MIFNKALPIWLKGKSKELNCQAGFICEFEYIEQAELFITGATFFRIYINDKFIHYGPARAAKGYARVDKISISEYLINGKNKIFIECAGYNCNSYYTINQPSYIQAEIISNNKVLYYTALDFKGVLISQRVQNVMRYSFQRHFSEVWDELSSNKKELVEKCFSGNGTVSMVDYYENENILILKKSQDELQIGIFNIGDEPIDLIISSDKFKIDKWCFKEHFKGEAFIGEGSFINFPKLEAHSSAIWDFIK
jgi:hypothetical protein